MGMFREHLAVSCACGTALGAGMWVGTPATAAQAGVAATLTAVGGMLPDLDSDAGRPIREVTALLGAAVPMVAVRRLIEVGHSLDAAVGLGILSYWAVRYGGSFLLKRWTVHRGMFHSVPAMVVAGLLAFLAYAHPHPGVRLLMATAVMTGYASHLMLDEWRSVDWSGLTPRLKSSAGTAVKWAGPDAGANAVCYTLLACCAYAAAASGDLIDVDARGLPVRQPDSFHRRLADPGPLPAAPRWAAADADDLPDDGPDTTAGDRKPRVTAAAPPPSRPL